MMEAQKTAEHREAAPGNTSRRRRMERLAVPSLNKGKLVASVLGLLAAVIFGIMIEKRWGSSANEALSAADDMSGETTIRATIGALLAIASIAAFCLARVQDRQTDLAVALAETKDELAKTKAVLVAQGESHAADLQDLVRHLASRTAKLLRAGERAETALEQMTAQSQALKRQDVALQMLAGEVANCTAASARHFEQLSNMVAGVLVEGWIKGHPDEALSANESKPERVMAGAQIIPLHPVT